MIELDDLWKTFHGQPVLRGVQLRVAAGEFLALIGLSGSGKSVLLKHIVKLLQPDRGQIRIDGQPLSSLSGSALEALRSRIGYVFQSGALFDSMTVFDNVAFPLRERTGLAEAQIRKRVLAELEQVGLAGAENKFPAQLSGGMVKRVALARTLVRDPQIILFDEPTTGLDPIVTRSILELFDSSHRRLGLTGIIVSHDLPAILSIVQRVALLHEGVIVAEEKSETTLSSRNPYLRQFVDGASAGPIRFR